MPRSLRRAPALLTLLVIALFAAACGSDSDSGGGEPDRPQVGLVQINQQAIFFNQMNEGAQEAADELGVDLTIFNANDDPVQQNQAIDNFVQQQFDAIIVVAIDVEGVKPAIQTAKDAGVNIIAVDAIVDSPAVDVQVGVDNADAAQQIGEFVNDWAAEAGIQQPKVGVVGALNSFIQNIRGDEFVATVETAGASVVQTVDGKNVQEDALAAAENLLTARNDLDLVYATGEPALLGTIAAVRSQGAEDLAVFGWDLTAEAIEAIDAGAVQAVVQQDPKTEGIEAVTAADTLIDGGTVEQQINVPITIVTQENVDPYRPIFE